MILRKFAKHMTEQNWFAVGLDVIVVITGIFLGMQVTDWNEVRKERTDETINLVQFKEDIEKSMALGENFLKDHTKHREAIITLMIMSPTEAEELSGEAFHDMVRNALYDLNRLSIQRKTWQELINRGELKSFGDEGLRISINTVVALQDAMIKRASNLDIYTRDVIDPWLTEKVEVWRFVKDDFSKRPMLEEAIKRPEKINAAALLQDKKMRNMMAYRYSFLTEDMEVYHELKTAYLALQNKLDNLQTGDHGNYEAVEQ